MLNNFFNLALLLTLPDRGSTESVGWPYAAKEDAGLLPRLQRMVSQCNMRIGNTLRPFPPSASGAAHTVNPTDILRLTAVIWAFGGQNRAIVAEKALKSVSAEHRGSFSGLV
jgi:hypothetical protein